MITLAASQSGILVGWAEGPWPLWARLASHRALAPEWSRSLGTGLGGRPTCLVGWHQGEPLALHTDLEGVRLVRGEPGGEGGLSTATLPGRDPLAFTDDGEGLVVATTEAEGIRLTRVAGETVRPQPELALTRRDVEHVALLRSWHGYVLVAGLERALTIVALDTDLRVLQRVRHPLRASLRALHATEAGGRVALALTYAPPAHQQVDAALLDASGAVRERPHPILRGALHEGHVHWDEHGFRISARDDDGRLLSRRLDRAETQVLMEGIHRPFAIAHDYGRTLVASVDGSSLALRVRGHQQMVRPSALELTPEDAPRLRRVEAIRALGARWEQLRERSGYRGDQGSMRWDPLRLEAVFPPLPGSDTARGLRVGFALSDGALRLVVVVGEAGEEAPRASWARLIRWLRRRLSADGRAAHERALARARPVVGDEPPDGTRIEAMGDAVLLEMPLAELPSAETLDGWARAILAER